MCHAQQALALSSLSAHHAFDSDADDPALPNDADEAVFPSKLLELQSLSTAFAMTIASLFSSAHES
eukprot:CAMPEP_0173470520 /NCGR_PEP_ID=MMETSP1357-20121228/77923_1 /TAXON_ID=77926 /ORGANISM="Hemiselmis rufescens, Strain PCC563" /LENGTH=65 /DNA_ID=CAMNT_0014438801 /DNA_START=238 /DNA_END=435 /DNA_ORIENTATION=+